MFFSLSSNLKKSSAIIFVPTFEESEEYIYIYITGLVYIRINFTKLEGPFTCTAWAQPGVRTDIGIFHESVFTARFIRYTWRIIPHYKIIRN